MKAARSLGSDLDLEVHRQRLEIEHAVEAERLRQSMEASEKERRRWARDLHDETLQELGAIKVMLDAALRNSSLERLAQAVADGAAELERTIDGLHAMIMELRPITLDEFGIEVAVASLVERRREADPGIDIALDVDLAYERLRVSTRLAPDVESTAYRLIQEALTNASKHSHAGRVQVRIAEDDERLLINVSDDGDGFDLAAKREGLGLIGMRERLELIGGALDIESAVGQGTTVRALLPVRRADEATASSDGAGSA